MGNEDCHGAAGSKAGQIQTCTVRCELRPGKPEVKIEGFPLEVYVLLSEKDANHRYTDFTDDLEARLKSHNQGNNRHTSKYRPWHIETATAFRSREKAAAFEKCLKTPIEIRSCPQTAQQSWPLQENQKFDIYDFS